VGATARSLKGAAGDIVDLALHPTLPYLVVLRTDGALDLFGLPSGERIATLLASQS
jgi:hypothetical protein